MIKVSSLSKSFKISQKRSGASGFFKNLLNSEYDIKKAVDNISFKVNKGELVGYIGQNGSGKSTTVKMLCGALYPDEGQILVNGINPFTKRNENAMNIGVVFGQRTQLWYDVPVYDSFILLKKIYQVTEKDFNERFGILDDVLDIKELLRVPVKRLSLGQRMRCEFAASLIHWPEVLYLDEPTIGIDNLARKKIVEFISWLNQECKKTILLTTHNMNDVEKLCKKVILLDKGKIIFDGQTDALKQMHVNYKKIVLNFVDTIKIDCNKIFDESIAIYLNNIEKDENRMIITTENDDINLIGKIIRLVDEHQKIRNFEVNLPSLESIIEDIYAEEKNYEKSKVI